MASSLCACATLEMAHIGLRSTQLEWLFPTVAQGGLQGPHFHGIAKRCTSAMRLQAAMACRAHSSLCQC